MKLEVKNAWVVNILLKHVFNGLSIDVTGELLL